MTPTESNPIPLREEDVDAVAGAADFFPRDPDAPGPKQPIDLIWT